MCLGIPGKVVATWGDGPERMATVEFGGVTKQVCLAYVPEVVVGDYTIVHVGFALTRLDEASALETLALFDSLGLIDEEFYGTAPAAPTQEVVA
jgi:hydrogenase expression/formation protein HypC